MKPKDIKGKKFGRLTPLERSGTAKNGSVIWKCICECGNETNKIGSLLISGATSSCGCKHRERAKLFNRLPPGEAALKNKFSHYRKTAKKRYLSFDISIEIFQNIITSECHFCGAPPQMVFKPKTIVESFPMNGIDRKDNSLGYTIDNCLPCCGVCNFMKGRLDYYDFIARCGNIYLFRKLQK